MTDKTSLDAAIEYLTDTLDGKYNPQSHTDRIFTTSIRTLIDAAQTASALSTEKRVQHRFPCAHGCWLDIALPLDASKLLTEIATLKEELRIQDEANDILTERVKELEKLAYHETLADDGSVIKQTPWRTMFSGCFFERSKLDAENETLRTSLSSNSWRPISDAPRDGTKVILLCAKVKTEHAPRWAEGRIEVCGFDNGDWPKFNSVHWPPTHWMPLPESPKS